MSWFVPGIFDQYPSCLYHDDVGPTGTAGPVSAAPPGPGPGPGPAPVAEPPPPPPDPYINCVTEVDRTFVDWSQTHKARGIDSVTFSKTVKDLKGFLQHPELSPQFVFTATSMAYTTLHMAHKFDPEIAVPSMSRAVRSEGLANQARTLHTRLHNPNAVITISQEIYRARFPLATTEHFVPQLINDESLLRVQSRKYPVDEQELYNHFMNLYTVAREARNLDTQQNILDVLLRHFPRDRTVRELYEELAGIRGPPPNVQEVVRLGWDGLGGVGPARPTARPVVHLNTTFNNSQNVHAESIADGIVYTGSLLVRDMNMVLQKFAESKEYLHNTDSRVLGEIMQDEAHLKRYLWFYLSREKVPPPRFYSRLSAFVSRTLSDPVRFKLLEPSIEKFIKNGKIDKNDHHTLSAVRTGFTLHDLVRAIIIYSLDRNPQRKVDVSDVWARVLDEISECYGTCITGHISRVVNILSGLDERYTFTTNFVSQLRDRLSLIISKAMNDASDDVVTGTYDSNYAHVYCEFVAAVVNKNIHEVIADYSLDDVLMSIEEALKHICQKTFIITERDTCQVLYVPTPPQPR